MVISAHSGFRTFRAGISRGNSGFVFPGKTPTSQSHCREGAGRDFGVDCLPLGWRHAGIHAARNRNRRRRPPDGKGVCVKAVKWLDTHFEEAILVFFLVVIACVELVQVVCRNVPVLPTLTWPEELCRFAWIATVFLSLPYTIRTSNMLRVSVMIDALPYKIHNALDIFVDVVTTLMMGILAYQSVAVMQRIYASGETSPAMLWPMWVMYLIVLVGLVLATARSIEMIVIHIIHFNEIPPTMVEEKMEAESAEEWVRPVNLAEGEREHAWEGEGFARRDSEKGGDA